MSYSTLNIALRVIAVVSLTPACRTTQPPTDSTNAILADSIALKTRYTEVSTNEDGVSARSYTPDDIPPEQLRIIHAEQVSRLTKGTAEKPIIDGKRAALKLVLNGAGSGRAPTTMTVDAPRNGTLRIQLVNVGTSELTTLPHVTVSKGISDVPLNLGGLASGVYTIRVTEGALTASAGFSIVH